MIQIATTDNITIEYTPNGGTTEKLNNFDYFDTPNFSSITGAENNADTAIELFHNSYKLVLTFESADECKAYYGEFLESLANRQSMPDMSGDMGGISDLFGGMFGDLGKVGGVNPEDLDGSNIPDESPEVPDKVESPTITK